MHVQMSRSPISYYLLVTIYKLLHENLIVLCFLFLSVNKKQVMELVIVRLLVTFKKPLTDVVSPNFFWLHSFQASNTKTSFRVEDSFDSTSATELLEK